MTIANTNITTIGQVIDTLGKIVAQAVDENDAAGYFAALYQKVTIRVKEGIENHFFDDGPRMEKLDVIFALRYIDAYHAWKNHRPVTASWQRAFENTTRYRPIVFQHLLLGMNAHINLDLAIAAAEVSEGQNIFALEKDFIRINDILASLVDDVQQDLAAIWPTLKKLLRLTGRADDFMVDFSMKLARNGAWKHACILARCNPLNLETLIRQRDQKVSRKAGLIVHPGWIAQILFGIIRLGEKGTVASRIGHLKYVVEKQSQP